MSSTRARDRARSPYWSASSLHALSRGGGVEEDAVKRRLVAEHEFSATVITGISMKCWCTMPIPGSIASWASAS